MSTEELVTKITWPLQRANGAEAKIVASVMFGAGLTPSYDVFVLYRETNSEAWRLCDKSPNVNWREMSVDDYIHNGRPEMLSVVTPGEILRAMSWLLKPMTEFNAYMSKQN